MNSVQRKFLIEKIQTETKNRINLLEKQKETFPSASNYVFKAILDGKLKLKPAEHTLNILKQRALPAKEGNNWLSGDAMGWSKERAINFYNYSDILEMPEDYNIELKRVKEVNSKIEAQIEELKMYLNGIEMRIQLASDSTLKKLINEVDDMGDIKLIDTQVKLLGN